MSKPQAFSLPEWLDSEVWQDFEAIRTKLKKPLIDRSRRTIITKLKAFHSQGMNPNEVLEQSIENCWLSVYPLRNHQNKSSVSNWEGERAPVIKGRCPDCGHGLISLDLTKCPWCYKTLAAMGGAH